MPYARVHRRYPVTQEEFATYLKAVPSALPSDTYNYLKNWDWSDAKNPVPGQGKERLPVTYLGIDEARAYCKWAGKRFPTSIEWQYAAQGGDTTRMYPWGNDNNQSLYPAQQTGTVYHGPEPVDKHGAASLSPFGVGGLVGGVWQYTDEFVDDHTRGVVLRGGSNYRPSGSQWYVQHNRSVIRPFFFVCKL